MAITGANGSATSGADLSQVEITNYTTVSFPDVTEEKPRQRGQNYKDPRGTAAITPISGEHKLQTTVKGVRHVPAQHVRAEPEPQRFSGVVDRIDPASSNVTLFYGGRENAFLLPTELLKGAGADHVGALFEIVMKTEDGFHSYEVIHKADEERNVRAAAPAPNLAFLDDLEPPAPRVKRK